MKYWLVLECHVEDKIIVSSMHARRVRTLKEAPNLVHGKEFTGRLWIPERTSQ